MIASLLAREYCGLPDDRLNFHHDSIACMTALHVPGITVQRIPARIAVEDHLLRMRVAKDGKPIRVVMAVDVPAVTSTWLKDILGAQPGTSFEV